MSDYKKSGGFGGNRGGNRDFAKKDFGGRPSFGGNRGGGDRGGRPSQMFSAICDECQKSCEVPFRPSGDKPVYCSNCFGAKREGGNNDYQKRDFTPSPSRAPVSSPVARPASDDFKNQFNSLNAKLDKLIEMMSKNTVKNIAPVAQIQKVAPVVVAIKKVVAPVKKAVIAPKKEVKKVVLAPKKVVAKIVLKKKVVSKKK